MKKPTLENSAASFVAMFRSWKQTAQLARNSGGVKPAPREMPEFAMHYAMNRAGNYCLELNMQLGARCTAVVQIGHDASIEITEMPATASSQTGGGDAVATMRQRAAILAMASAIAEGCAAEVAK